MSQEEHQLSVFGSKMYYFSFIHFTWTCGTPTDMVSASNQVIYHTDPLIPI